MKKSLVLILATLSVITSLGLVGCAHTGLATGPKIEGPNVDRSIFIGSADSNQTAEQYTPSAHDFSELEENIQGADTIKSSINDVKNDFQDTNSLIKDNVSEFSNNKIEMNDEIETQTLPELMELNTEFEKPELSLNQDDKEE